MEICGVDQKAKTLTNTSPPKDIYDFLLKANSEIGIEELILGDTKMQRRAGRAQRNSLRNQRKRQVERAVAKLKAAARDKFKGSFLAGAVNVVMASAGCVFTDLFADKLGMNITNFVSKGFSIAGELGAQHNFLYERASAKEAQAMLLQQEATAAGESANEIGEWLQSAKELEQRMIASLEKAAQAQHQTQLGVIQKIGA